jgi:CubicO group peptidase (beta-lactamase class C family)
MQRQQIPGLALGIADQGRLTARGYGYANLEHQVPVTPDTIFQSGSVGKMFTATAVMLQVEDGKLSLDDPFVRFFPNAARTWRVITVRHLLTHTSGIPDYATKEFDYRTDYTDEQRVQLMYRLRPEFPPGTRWNYSNTGYLLLGLIIQKVSGKFYGDVLNERVFKPLGMTTARVINAADIVPHRAASYELVEGEIKNVTFWVAPDTNTTADGALYLTVRDLLAWNAAVERRAILKPESWQQILTPVRLASGRTYPYGFGWSLEERAGKPMHWHTGAWQGFQTQLSRFVGDDLAIIVLTNADQADTERVTDGIAAIFHPDLAPPKLAAITDEPQVTARLTRLLDQARAGKLQPTEFAYVRAGFFPTEAQYYQAELERLGQPSRISLVEHRELGDDRVYTYELTFGSQAYYATLGLAPDNRLSSFSLSEKVD